MWDALVLVLSRSRRGFEKEGLFCGHVVEKELLDGGLSTSARRNVEIGDNTKTREGRRTPVDPRVGSWCVASHRYRRATLLIGRDCHSPWPWQSPRGRGPRWGKGPGTRGNAYVVTDDGRPVTWKHVRSAPVDWISRTSRNSRIENKTAGGQIRGVAFVSLLPAMKFGRKISVSFSRRIRLVRLVTSSQNDLYTEWRPFYIDYNLLKRELKVISPFLTHPLSRSQSASQARTTSHNWNATDEEEFTNLLEGELDKIHDFQKAKVYLVAVPTLPPSPWRSVVLHPDHRAVQSHQDCRKTSEKASFRRVLDNTLPHPTPRPGALRT